MSISPVLRGITCPGWNGEPLRTAEPLAFSVTLEIGDDGKPGCDLFYMSICNPPFLSAKSAFEWQWQDQMLVLATLSLANVETAVAQKVQKEGPYESWPDFATQMAPYMKWEFAGMPYPPG